MKNITIIGIGTCLDTVTAQGLRAIEKAEVLIGGKLTTDNFTYLNKKIYAEWEAEKIKSIIQYEMASNIAVLVSGDVGFYSVAEQLEKILSDFNITFLPGISTVQAFFAKIKIPWKEAALISMHGGTQNIIDIIRRNKYTFTLTSKHKHHIYEKLMEYDFESIITYVGENLGNKNERVFKTTVKELCNELSENRTVFVFENLNANKIIRFGISDNDFFRKDKIPMTKSEVRAVVMSKLSIKPSDICFDIGSGSGSVAVEMGFAAYYGKVYAIDKKEEAVNLIKQNAKKFQVGNIVTINDAAKNRILDLPSPDAVFIGGTNGEIYFILEAILKNNSNAKIVATAVTLESIATTIKAFEELKIKYSTVQINAVRYKKKGAYSMPDTQNAVTIICREF